MEQVIQAATSPPPMRRMVMAVGVAGDKVVCKFGNVETKTTYEDAMLISHWIWVRAQQAKRWSGGGSRWRIVGTLTDASGKLPDDTGIARARDISMVPKGSWRVEFDANFVVINIRRTTLRLWYPDAITLSQWIRANAKEAKRRAGDLRHWSEFHKAHEKQYGPNITRG